MDLWIRSQGNYEVDITPRLIKANDIFLDYCGENDSYYILVNNGIEVAYYSSEKKALEVLTEIQNILNLKNMYKYDRELVLKSWENVDEEQVKIVRQQMSVYEMPNE